MASVMHKSDAAKFVVVFSKISNSGSFEKQGSHDLSEMAPFSKRAFLC
jgi:hypothetical protein